MSLGTLHVQLVEAKFTRSTDAIRKMDPYVVIKVRDFKWTSEIIHKGGKEPNWNDAKFEIDVKYLGDDFEYAAFDEDPGKDEKIGDGESKISAFCCQAEWEEWFPIEHKGKTAGKIHLKTKWVPTQVAAEHDEMGELNALMREAVARKKELENKHHEILARQEANEKAGLERLAAAEA